MSHEIRRFHRGRQRHQTFMKFLGVIFSPVIVLLRGIYLCLQASAVEKAISQIFCPIVKIAFSIHSKKAFANYSPSNKDVFVCSDMKSGTNWTMQIAHQIANRGKGEFAHIHDVVAWPDGISLLHIVPLSSSYPTEQSATGLRVIKTHNVAQLVPYDEKAKYICVVRDPKAVFVSSYFFLRSVIFGHLMPSVATWLALFLSHAPPHGQWAHFVASYWAWRDRANVLFLTFEEMKDDLSHVVQSIARLLEVELTAEEFAKVCERSSFQYMKSIDHKFYPGQVTPLSLPGSMMRSGKKDSSRELINEEQRTLIDNHCRQTLKDLQCDFPYDRYYKLS